jgi:hypothetical protein
VTEQNERLSVGLAAELILAAATVALFFYSTIFDLLWPRIGSSAVFVVLATRRALRDRDRMGFVSAGVLAIGTGLGVARKLSDGAGGDAALLVSLVVIALFVVPLPLLMLLYARGGDEFQRSLVVSSGAIAMAVTIAGSIGYSIVDRSVGMPELDAHWIALAATALWAVSWAILRGRAT